MTCSRLLIHSPMKVTIVYLQSVLAMQIENPPSAEIRSDVTALLELPHCLLESESRRGGRGRGSSSFEYGFKPWVDIYTAHLLQSDPTEAPPSQGPKRATDKRPKIIIAAYNSPEP